MPWERRVAFMAALVERDGSSALALRFVILTAAQAGEVRRMRWRAASDSDDHYVYAIALR
jgi:hypothetical protein